MSGGNKMLDILKQTCKVPGFLSVYDILISLDIKVG